LRDGVLLVAQPGAVPAAALDEIIRKARALDMSTARRSLAERAVARAADAGGR
jgi:thioredoxin 1